MAPVTRATQGVLLTLVGAVLIRITIDDTYLRYVNTWMRWPILVCGVVLVLLSVSDLVTSSRGPDEGTDEGTDEEPGEEPHRAPRTAWLLFLPPLVIFFVSPPALGAFLAERATEAPAPSSEQLDSMLAPLPEEDPVELSVTEFFVRAVYDQGVSLPERRVSLVGFVSLDDDGHWYVTRLGINCCAADATVTRVVVTGADAPPRDQWVRVTGTWVDGSGTEKGTTPAVDAEDVETVPAPRYEYE
ncbi:TIGR03943 family putative permease subunit [Nocardioides lijunqiniae]|uniref:TIGR03943 family putative permease subunit n=1 Tax=Nocardioides lijunqiniae TaxID=2760832 RepID=UPI001878076D